MLPPSRSHLFDEVRFHGWQVPNRRSNQKNLLYSVQCWTDRLRFGVIHDHASNPAGALAAMSGDWKVARMFSPTASSCFNTSRPMFPLAPVIRIIAVSL